MPSRSANSSTAYFLSIPEHSTAVSFRVSATRQEAVISFWVYILRCADDSYYTGHTDNLERRIAMHQQGDIPGYTSTRRPVELVFSQACSKREEALAAELQIKGWSRQKKAALIRGDWRELSELAKRRDQREG